MTGRRNQPPELPQEAYEHLTAAENTHQAVAAMERFIREGDEEAFEDAVAIYVASARSRREPVETVTGALCMLAENLEGPRTENEVLLRPTRMHELLFGG